MIVKAGPHTYVTIQGVVPVARRGGGWHTYSLYGAVVHVGPVSRLAGNLLACWATWHVWKRVRHRRRVLRRIRRALAYFDAHPNLLRDHAQWVPREIA